MTWFRVDDGFHDHPKTQEASMAARGLWVTCGSYCSRHLTDGHITSRQVRKEGGTSAQIRSLLDCGLWKVCDLHPNCYSFHDWIEQQPQRNDVLNRRAEDAERKRKAREAKRDNQQKHENVQPDTDSDVRPESALPDPTRPDHIKKQRSANAAPTTEKIEQTVTVEAYEQLGKAFNFMAVRQIVKWAIHTRGTEPTAVKAAVIAIHQAGRPITKQTVDQWLTRSDRSNQRDPKSGLLVER
ncbi:hypothetical protein SEA_LITNINMCQUEEN_93 [Gordonia phage LitninMcQueen]